MAAPIALVSISAEQQAYELATKLLAVLNADKLALPDADRKSFNVSQVIDLTRLRATFTIVLPLSKTDEPDGSFTIDAEEVLA